MVGWCRHLPTNHLIISRRSETVTICVVCVVLSECGRPLHGGRRYVTAIGRRPNHCLSRNFSGTGIRHRALATPADKSRQNSARSPNHQTPPPLVSRQGVDLKRRRRGLIKFHILPLRDSFCRATDYSRPANNATEIENNELIAHFISVLHGACLWHLHLQHKRTFSRPLIQA